MVDLAIETLTEITNLAVPIAIVFEIGNLIISTFLRVAFGGAMRFGK